jgi:hypothetical protein
MTAPDQDVYAAFRAAVEAGDVGAAIALFADDAVFHSPVAHRPYHGRDALRAVLSAVFTVFEDFRYTGSYGGDDGHALRFATRVGDRELEGVDLLEARDGRLTTLTVMVRPYSAATALRDRMAALLGQAPPGT